MGVSRSAISRQTIEASEEQLRQLNQRRWDNVNLLVIDCDGQRFGEHHLISAVGVDLQGRKHVLGMESGATENVAGVKRLFTRLRDNGLKTDQKYLFVIDGAKALRAAIQEVFGAGQPVQRCRKHKERNVLAELPKEQHPNVQSLLRAAWNCRMPTTVKSASNRWRASTNAIIQRPPRAFAKVSPRCSPYSACRSRRRCTSAWRPPTSSKVRNPACAAAH